MSTLEELTTPLTVDEAKTAIYDAIHAQGTNTTSWKPGAVVRTIIAVVAIIVAAFSRMQAKIAASGFLDLATDSWLTLVAKYVYGVERQDATFASGLVTLTNAGGGVYQLDAGDLIVSNASGVLYRNTSEVNIGALETIEDVPVEAVEAGSGSSTGPNTITTLETNLLGVSVTNPSSLVGLDEQSDSSLRQACRDRIGILSPAGPRSAYEYFAKLATRSDGSLVGVTRVETTTDGSNTVTVYVATASGVVPGDQENPETDLGAVADALWKNVPPFGIDLDVISASPVAVDLVYEVWVRGDSGATEQSVSDAVEEAVAEWFAGFAIGGYDTGDGPGVDLSALASVIGSACNALRVEVSSPASSVALEPNEFPTLNSTTPTVNLL